MEKAQPEGETASNINLEEQQQFAAMPPENRSMSRNTAMKYAGCAAAPGAAGYRQQAPDWKGGGWRRRRVWADRGCRIIAIGLLGITRERWCLPPSSAQPVYVTHEKGSVEDWALKPALLGPRVLEYQMSLPSSTKIL